MTDGFAAVSRRRELGKNVTADLIATPRPKSCRHAERVSASTAQRESPGLVEGWILKQVQDDGRF
ncbi:hypothetical protein [Sphingomonas sp. PAMC 26617]|uniref:hypothetical protein n=1 Tax=Sphingomonas sp. PAMC 26617 TaxID=1112216 RepID=UPI0012F4EA3D|nr:hypothetical protein [Sphingomonas sp. PAMC 26617]